MNNTVGMDYLQEAIILGIDVIIFGLCLKGYHSHKNTIKALKVFYFICLHRLKNKRTEMLLLVRMCVCVCV